MSSKNAKTARRIMLKKRKEIAVDLAREIFDMTFLFRVKFSMRVIFEPIIIKAKYIIRKTIKK